MTPDQLSEQITAAARDMERALGHGNTMELAVKLGLHIVIGAQDAGITLLHRGKFSSPAVSSSTVSQIDKLQYELDEGPCLDASRESEVVESQDVRTDDRWPQWGPAAAEATGLRSMLSFRLFTHEETFGALNFYSRQVGAFDDVDREQGLAIAAHTAIAMAASHATDNLKSAVDGRTVIGQAQGILMERFDMDAAHAFAVLSRISSTSNRKLRDVAFDLVTSGQVPGLATEENR